MDIYEAVEKWGISDNIRNLGSDTKASNTGRLKGASIVA